MPTYTGNKKLWIEQALRLYCEKKNQLTLDQTIFMCTFSNEFCHLMNPLIQDAVNPVLIPEDKKKYDELAKRNYTLPKFRKGDKVIHLKNWFAPIPFSLVCF
ncbi:MAG: hypothetical protein EOP45_19280 [Sphingobacteriaceae bacterium]|nr:MAG: hypothetical protein EOP45_19280 [Sphingobacteriaceae bacterium]